MTDRPSRDPFGWLEERGERTTSWLDQRATEADRRLGSGVPAHMARELGRLTRWAAVSVPRRGGDRLFFWRAHPGGQPDTLQVVGPGAEERKLMDPASLRPPSTVRGMFPSPDGRWVACFQCPANRDEAEIVVLDADTGAERMRLPDARMQRLEWGPDSSGFLLASERRDAAAPPTLRWVSVPSGKQAVLAEGAQGVVVRLDARFARPDGPLIIEEKLVSGASRVSAVPLDDPLAPATRLLGPERGIGAPLWWKGRLWLQCSAGSPRGRIDRIGPGGERVVAVPEADGVLESLTVAGDHLVVTYQRDGATEIEVRDAEGGHPRRVELPGLGYSPGPEHSSSDTAWFVFSTPDRSPALFELDAATASARRWASAPEPVTVPEIRTRRDRIVTPDGVEIPLLVLEPARGDDDRRGPLLLVAYGGFGHCVRPQFEPLHAIWVRRGGTVVLAGVRGGGERGPAWHSAGRGPRKLRAVQDVIDCARGLVADGRTAARRLFAMGTSNGGMVVASAVLRDPGAFGAAVLVAPLADMLGYAASGLGARWRGEYGDPDDPEARAHLLELSPYRRALEPSDHPPILVLGNDRDDRVDPLHSRKLVAALQARGGRPVTLRNRPFGHLGPFTVEQQITQDLDILSFLTAVDPGGSP